MKLVFFRANKVSTEKELSQIEIQSGGIQFQFKDKIIVLSSTVIIKVKQNGLVQDVLSSIQFDIYNEHAIEPICRGCKWSLLSVLNNSDGAVYQELLTAIYGDKVVPISRARAGRNEASVYSERQLFKAEYEAAFKRLTGGEQHEAVQSVRQTI